METKEKTVKLTLQVRQRTVKKAKQYARKSNTSVSALVDSFIDSLDAAEQQGRVHPAVKALSGIIKGKPERWK